MTVATDDLLEQVSNYLKITWSDKDTDTAVEMLTNDAIDAMNHRLGSTKLNYTKAGAYRRLFLNYCLYSYNGCLEQFDKAYLAEINQLRDRLTVEARMAEDEEDDEEAD